MKTSGFKGFVFAVLLIGIACGTSSCAPVRDKWLVYALDPSQSQTPLYVGYKSFPVEKETECEKFQEMICSQKAEEAKKEFRKTDSEKLKNVGEAFETNRLLPGKPLIRESDETHVLVLLRDADIHAKCVKDEKGFNQTDASVVPPTPADGIGIKGMAGALAVSSPLICNLNSRGKGGKQINYKIYTAKDRIDKAGNVTDGKEELKLDDSVHVHALYRFRVMAGPVYSTLIKKNKSYGVVSNNSGQKVVSSSSNNDAPVNFPLLLKVYWAPEGRDILDDNPNFLYRLNPIVGVNLFDRPLQNFYLGMSFEPPVLRGLDIVAGAHWSKQTQLTGGFAEGQVTTTDSVPTREKFVNGWFVGVTVDIGVVGAWLTNSMIQALK